MPLSPWSICQPERRQHERFWLQLRARDGLLDPPAQNHFRSIVSQLLAAGNRGDVGSVVGDDVVEDLPCFGEVVGLGDDEDVVRSAASGQGDVQAAAGGRRGGHHDPSVLVVGLVAGFGGGVAEAHVLPGVVGWERDDASSVDAGGGDVAVSVDGGHDPLVAVADELAARRDERAVVAAGGDQVADVGADAVRSVGSAGAVEVAALPAEALDAVVDEVDVCVAGGRDRERLVPVVKVEPEGGHRVDVLVDRTDADAPARPGLASFLGAIGDRTWVYDAPSPDYPLARRTSLRPPTSWNEAGAQLVAGFDGCNAYSLNGSWTASGEGWQVADAAGSGTLVGCGDRPTVAVTNGSVLSLTPDGLLSVAAPDGTECLFRDIRAATLADMLQSPIAELPGRWELDPGIVVDIKLGTSPGGTGVIRFGTCGVNWWPTGNEWIGAEPVPADCVPPADSPSAEALLQLLDTGPTGTTPGPVERPITVGVNPERNALYLANDDGSTVLRLTRVDAASPYTVGEPADAMTINRPFVDPSICSPLAASESGWAEVILQPFAIGTDGPIAMQVFADPTLGPDGPFALLLRYRDRPEYLDVPDELVDVNGWQVGLRTLQPGTTEATWDLADGGRAYLRARDLDRETIVALVESLQVREKSADVAGFDIRGDRPLGASISMVAEHMNTGLAARGATFACTTPDTSIWRVSAIDADPIAAYTFALDRPRPLDVEVVGNTLILVGGPQSFVDRPLVRASDVVNADPATWQDLLGQPMP